MNFLVFWISQCKNGVRKAKPVVPDFGASFSFPDPFFAAGDSKYQEIHEVTSSYGMNMWHLLYCVFTYIYSLLIEKDICDRQNISIKLPCVCVCLSSGDLFIFSIRDFSFLFQFFFTFWTLLSLSVSLWTSRCGELWHHLHSMDNIKEKLDIFFFNITNEHFTSK